MQPIFVSNLVLFPALMLLNGSIAYFCWRVIKKNFQKRKKTMSTFNIIVTFPPMIAFGFGFFYFFILLIKSVAGIAP
jgi:hypothetical protein